MEEVVAEVNGGNAEMAQDDTNLETTDTTESEVTETSSKTTTTTTTESQDDTTESPAISTTAISTTPSTPPPSTTPTVASVNNDTTEIETTIKMEVDEVNGDVKDDEAVVKKIGNSTKRKLRKSKSNSTSSVETDTKLKTRGQKRKSPDLIDNNVSIIKTDDSSIDDDFFGFDITKIDDNRAFQILQKLIAETESGEISPLMSKRKRLLPKLNRQKDDNNEMIIDNDVKTKTQIETDKLKNDVKIINNNTTIDKTSESLKLNEQRSIYTEPFKYGWRRELIWKGLPDSNQKRSADIYYYSPKGKKLKSLKEISECLTTKELTLDNFTFINEPIGVKDPALEIIRDAKRLRSDSTGGTPSKKIVATKRTSISKKLPSPTQVVVTSKTPTNKLSSPKNNASAGFKVKMPIKRSSIKKDIKTTKDPEMLPPQWSSSSSTTPSRKSQGTTEKSLSPKNKKLPIKAKLQEPCSIKCSLSMGLIPDLRCSICLCLYHLNCVGGTDSLTKKKYICKNCQRPGETLAPLTSTGITPPPLIPISMIGTHSAKSKFSTTGLTPSIIQKPTKTDNDNIVSNNKSLKTSNSTNIIDKNNKEESIKKSLISRRKEYIHGHDGSALRPAQNIAILNAKSYIVIPKNNAMSVQPALKSRHSLSDKSGYYQDNLLNDLNERNIIDKKNITTKSSDNNEDDLEKSKEIIQDIIDDEREQRRSLEPSCDDDVAIDENKKDEPMEQDPTIHDVNDNKNEENNQIIEEKISEEVKENLEINNDNDEMKKNNDIEKENIEESNKNLEHDTIDNSKIIDKENETNIIDKKEEKIYNKKKLPMEMNPRDYFMVSVCAGYNALSRIFQYLKVQELLRASRVCRMWRDIAAQQVLWKTVRMKNSQVTDWDGLVACLKRHGTQHLDLRKMIISDEPNNCWDKFIKVIPSVASIKKLDLCRCPANVVQDIMKNCPHIEILNATSIQCQSLNIDTIENMTNCQELKLKALNGMSLKNNITPIEKLNKLSLLSLTSIKDLGKQNIEAIGSLINLTTLELGECSDFPSKFGTDVLSKLNKLEKIRLEKGQNTCCTFEIIDGISKLESIQQVELINFDIKIGFDKCIASCSNIKRLLIIPTYVSQSATSNNMILSGVTKLSDTLTDFIWGITTELLGVTELFVSQSADAAKQKSLKNLIPVSKPVPCYNLIENIQDDVPVEKDKKEGSTTNPSIEVLALHQLTKLLLAALPKTRIKILTTPFAATWRQSISDTISQ
ncbi:uncharacterized protein LOC122852779 [Aphidius gifuensis]|uniref:uncharacterized protein LOC122852779 n=1 Tax=Aphidius gifuensis TaxID=684658 RepID=UPI001CDC1F11|nr:uncharacterized protein LOC122852779 [Aphidius gifuensis]